MWTSTSRQDKDVYGRMIEFATRPVYLYYGFVVIHCRGYVILAAFLYTCTRLYHQLSVSESCSCHL